MDASAAPSRRTARGAGAGARALPRAALVIAALALAAGCRKGPDRAADPGAGPATTPPQASAPAGEHLATMADLVAATRLDARLQRVIALAGEYKMALTFDRAPRLVEHTDQVARRLDEAVPATEQAFDDLRDPRDRALAQPLLAGARRWPALLRDARAELLASPHPATRAAEALAATDDGVARALEAYRAFRATWRITDSPPEPEEVLDFLRARRELELEEAALGRSLPGGGSAGTGPSAEARARVDALVGRARKAASRLDEVRRTSANRFVESEAQALAALMGVAAQGSIDEQRERDALTYQIAKAGALDALAEYVALTARGSAAPR